MLEAPRSWPATPDCAGGGHQLVIAGGGGVLAVGRQQVGVALLGDVVAVAGGTEVTALRALQRSAADGAAEDAAAVGKTDGIVHKYLTKGKILRVC